MRYLSQKPAETIAYAKKVSARFRGGDVVLLVGGLGSGKTTFMKGVAGYFGVRQVIQSPTYVIAKIYRLRRNNRRARAKYLLHIDAYRITSRAQLAELGFEDHLGSPDVITCLENPGRLFHKNGYTHRISLRPTAAQARSITFR